MSAELNIGFVVEPGNWLGGKNYLNNLFSAIGTLRSPAIRPTILVRTRQWSQSSSDFPAVQSVPMPLLEKGTVSWFVRRVTARISSKDLFFRRALKNCGISALSHYSHKRDELGPDVPVLGWIPDFQHMHLPELFSEADRKERDQRFMTICDHSRAVIVSSESGRKDLMAFAPRFAKKARVLRFVANPFQDGAVTTASEVRQKYSIAGSYILLPNQFWIHKNHRVVISALSILKGRGQRVLILATGHTSDHRNPNAFTELMDYAQSCNVLESFRVLGVVPYRDLSALMRGAVAILNPSRFEGWSTSVEEAKSLGKLAILSDIPVHREQAPELAAYFKPDEAEVLAELLWDAFRRYDPQCDQIHQVKARDALVGRQQRFAEIYQKIVLDCLVKRETLARTA